VIVGHRAFLWNLRCRNAGSQKLEVQELRSLASNVPYFNICTAPMFLFFCNRRTINYLWYDMINNWVRRRQRWRRWWIWPGWNPVEIRWTLVPWRSRTASASWRFPRIVRRSRAKNSPCCLLPPGSLVGRCPTSARVERSVTREQVRDTV